MKKPHIPHALPIANINWEPLIPFIGNANRAISLYSGLLYGIPNPEVLLSPLATQEAVISSRIEGTEATLSDVLKFEAGIEPDLESRARDVQEIMNYRKALETAEFALVKKPFNLNLLLKLHDILLDSVRGRDKARGRFRGVQNWIGSPGSTIEKATYLPPDPLAAKKLMYNWELYYHMQQPDPLVQLAVLHAQFELIHPFLDGNGRLGRMLVPLFLYEKQLLTRPMFYVSQYFESNRDEYYLHLKSLGEPKASWNAWILFFLKAISAQADENVRKARAILKLYETLKPRVIELTHSQFAVPLLDFLFANPMLRTSDLRKRKGMPSPPMINSMLGKLCDAGILRVEQEGRGRRPYVYSFPELIQLSEGTGKPKGRRTTKRSSA